MPTIQTPTETVSNGSATLSVLQDWGGGFEGQITIDDLSALAANGWEIEIQTSDTFTGWWGFTWTEPTPGTYILTPSNDANIAAGGNVTIGFNADEPTDTAPITVNLVQLGSITATSGSGAFSGTATSSSTTTKTTTSTTTTSTTGTGTAATPAATPGATAVLAVTDDWGSGFTGQVTITNTGTTAITGWEVALDTTGHMTGWWNANLVSTATGVTLLSNDQNDGTIAPGASITIGFNMDRDPNSSAISVAVAQLTTAAGVITASSGNSAGSSSSTSSTTSGGGTTPAGSSSTGSATSTPPSSSTSATVGSTSSSSTGSSSSSSTSTTSGSTSPTTGSSTTSAGTASTPNVSAVLAVTDDWGSGFTGQVTVTNNGTTALSGWEVGLNTLGTITGWWNANVVSTSSGEIVLQNQQSDGSIAAGASVTFGFNMDRSTSSSAITVDVVQVTNSAGTIAVGSTTGTASSSGSSASSGSTTSSSSTGSSSTTTTSGSAVNTYGIAPLQPSASFTVPVQHAGQFQYLGVNLSGAEFGNPDPNDGVYTIGTYGSTYTYPTDAEINYYASEGLNVIRLPFTWERLQPTENGPLDPTQLSYMDSVVQYAESKGISVVIDPHNYGYGYGNVIGSAGTPDSAFDNLWGQLAAHYANMPNVIFGLMNEPHVQDAADVGTIDNTAIAAIRAAGATQEILVPGTEWDSGAMYTTDGNSSILAPMITDPLHNYAFEIHQYFNSDGSGDSPEVVSPTIGVQDLTAVTQWAQQTGNKLFLGEFGAASDSASLTTLQNTLAYMQQNSNVWQGGTEWGGGPWWGNYFFGLDPVNGQTQPQVSILSSFAPHNTVTA